MVDLGESSGVRSLTILEELKVENDFIQTLINTIPPKAYFDEEILECLEKEKCRTTEQVVKGMPLGRQAVISIKGKQKRARLNPYQHKTVSQIQQDLLSDSLVKKKGNFKIPNSSERFGNIAKLQEKLKHKLQEMQSVRHKNGVKKRTKDSKALRKKGLKQKHVHKSAPGSNISPVLRVDSPKPIFNKEGKIVFSKFDLADSASGSSQKDPKKKIDKGGKALMKALKKAESEKEKIKKLTEQDPVKAQQAGDLKMWQRAVKKAEGSKLKDDPDKIKASLKKREKKKGKSRKGWHERTEKLNQKMKEKQDKRKSNINKKKQEKKDKKIKHLKKKGRVLPPGF